MYESTASAIFAVNVTSSVIPVKVSPEANIPSVVFDDQEITLSSAGNSKVAPVASL